MSTRRSLLALLALALCLASTGAALAQETASPESGLELQLLTDESVYLEGQPIEVVAIVRNNGKEDFRDLAPLHPAGGWLTLYLVDATTNRALRPWRSPALFMADAEGFRLGPGEDQCEGFRLFDWFRSEKPLDDLGASLGYGCLPPGNYTLSSVFAARTGAVESLHPVAIKSKPIEFSIEPIRTDPAESELVAQFRARLVQLGPDREERAAVCKAWLPKFSRSRFFLPVYLGMGTLIPSVDPAAVLRTLDQRGGNGVRQACMLAFLCAIDTRPDSERRHWIAEMWKQRSDPLSRSLLTTWMGRTPGD